MTPEATIPLKDDNIELLREVAGQPENTTGLLFHGSPQVINLLEPRPVYWKGPKGDLYDDSIEPVVCASDKPFIATFMALVPREADWGYISKGDPDSLRYYLEASFKQQFIQSIGYVMVLSVSGFEKVVPPIPAGWKYDLPIGGRQPEMRSKNMVKPLYAIKVTYDDFEKLLQIQGDSRIEYR
ncbi:hypothetical protein EYC58_02890 [Candidatus Saccharibacteria bacterium]|nr:MAG: hypothetical protein EYC58_02890 [Candidatus Saccharibacteria bacterium]